MIEIPSRVKRVSHFDRVSPKKILAADSASFEVGANFIPKLSDALILSRIITLSFLFFFFVFLANTVLASSITKEKVIELTNGDRGNKGISALVESDKLSQAATDKADDMISKNYFSHTSSEGVTPWHWMEKENYDYDYAGENLAMDFTSAEKMNEAWLASPTHRNNILNQKYEDIGVAIREGIISGHATILVVQMFGSGDKSEASQKEAQKESVTQQENGSKTENYYPLLPLDGKKNNRAGLASMEPVITSPSVSGIIAGGKQEIIGRAVPLSRVTVFDKEEEIGTANVDENGWFSLKVKNLAAGEHDLSAKSESGNAWKRETRFSSRKIVFKVDADKPEIRYQLYAEKTSGNQRLLKINVSEKNCALYLEGRKIFLGGKESAMVSISDKWLAGMIRVEDQAGNKTFQEINFANLHERNDQSDFMKNLAERLLPNKALAADSGREAIRNNLGLVMEK